MVGMVGQLWLELGLVAVQLLRLRLQTQHTCCPWLHQGGGLTGMAQPLQQQQAECDVIIPNINIADAFSNYFRRTVITTIVTANTQCRNVVANRDYDRGDT